jgi:hypothetical protein
MSIANDTYRTIDPVLTTLMQGYSNSNMVADALFPAIPVPNSKGKIPIFNKNAFIIRDTNRASGAMSNRIGQTEYDLVTYETTEKDIEMAIDYLDEEQSDSFFKIERKVTKDLTDIILLGKEQQAANFAQNDENYSSYSKFDSSDMTFQNSTTNPIEIVKDCANSVRNHIGRNPNTAIIGASVYRALLENPIIIERVKFSGLRRVNTTILSELFEIPYIKIGYAQYASDGEVFEDVWKDNIVLAYVDENEKSKRSEFNPSYGYTLQKKGNPEIDSYFENGGKIKVIRCTDNYTLQVTCKDAAFLIYNCLTPQD